jgi:CHASE2 domain-containing sensor protein
METKNTTQKLLILNLDGSFENGFKVTLEVRTTSQKLALARISGKLSSNIELLRVFRQWQQRYASLESIFRALSHSDLGQITNSSSRTDAIEACKVAGDVVEQELERWLNTDLDFAEIRTRFLQSGQKFRLWIQTDDIWLQRLPWERWNILQDALVEVGLVISEYEITERRHSPRSRVRILAILGHATDLHNLDTEKQILDELAGLAGAEIVWQTAPSPQKLNELLRQGNWDILFFSGHSASTADGKRCSIQLTADHQLEIPDFRFSLRMAAQKGLQLAIFNSCDGIGLAHQLANERGVAMPHLVFMREKLPDAVSPQFLQQFLTAFISNQSLYASVQQAQHVLHDDWEKAYPCASWLPVVCPNPLLETPTWHSLSSDIQKRQQRRSIFKTLAGSLVIVAIVGGLRASGILQDLELLHYDVMMEHKPLAEKVDERLVVITIDKDDMDYQDQQNMKRAFVGKTNKKRSLAGQALSQLLKKITPYQPRVIALDLQRPIAAAEDYPPLAEQLKKTPNFIGICYDRGQVVPPPELAGQQAGFSDVVFDIHSPTEPALIRRYLYQAQFNPQKSPCSAKVKNSDYKSSFALSIVDYYLEKDPSKRRKISEIDGTLHLNAGNNSLTSLLNATGPYSRFKDMQEALSGKQVMLDFRRVSSANNAEAIERIAPSISLREVLGSNFEATSFRDKIVLIGVTESEKDYFLTPFNKNPMEAISGVYLHAQAVSQLLDHFIQGKPPIKFLLLWQEAFWVMGWSIGGGLYGWKFGRPLSFILANGVAVIFLGGSCLLLFNILLVWVPIVPTAIGMFASAGFARLVTAGNWKSFPQPFDKIPTHKSS